MADQTSKLQPGVAANQFSFNVVWIILLLIVTGIMLYAGLRPFGNYSKNWLEYDTQANATMFKGYGLAHGHLSRFSQKASIDGDLAVLLELTIADPDDGRFRILAQLDSPDSDDPLIIGQWRTGLITINSRDYSNQLGLPRASTNLERHLGERVEVLLRYGRDKTTIAVDGKVMSSGAAFSFESPLSRISVGNAPNGQQGWAGTLHRFALLSADSDETLEDYGFAQNNLPEVVNKSAQGEDLIVPKPGKYPDATWLTSLSLEQLLEHNTKDLVLNFFGFAPFGFIVAALMRQPRPGMGAATAVVVATGASVLFSLFIELSQTRLPGRSPHMHDLLLNSSGGLIGAVAAVISLALLALLASWRSKKELAAAELNTEA